MNCYNLSYQLSAISCQISAISDKLSAISCQISAVSGQISAISRQLVLGGLIAICLCGCSGQKAESKQPHAKEAIPPIVALCDGIDYADTASLHSEQAMAAHMTEIVKLMMKSDSTATAKALDVFFRGLHGDVKSLRLASHYAYLYLGNPNSPVRNESFYIDFLSSLLRQRDIPEDVSARAEDRLHRALLNRPGTIATDLRYIDREGNEGSLHSLKAPQTLLVFYDPECPHCPEILQRIAGSPEVNAAIESGDLKVLAVYTEGKRDLWEERIEELPRNWTVAYDLTGVVDAELYDIPAMPTVYLLDADKRVLVKDMIW